MKEGLQSGRCSSFCLLTADDGEKKGGELSRLFSNAFRTPSSTSLQQQLIVNTHIDTKGSLENASLGNGHLHPGAF